MQIENKTQPATAAAIPSPQSVPTFFGLSARKLSLVTLSVQNSSLILVMRYSRTLPGPLYMASTAVFLAECLKFLISFYMAIQQHLQQHQQSVFSFGLNSIKYWINYLWILLGSDTDAWKMAVPAILYSLQNNLQYLALTKLDAATYQVTAQLKIVTTAILSVFMLKRSLSLTQWKALIYLTVGVILVQLPTGPSKTTSSSSESVSDQTDYVSWEEESSTGSSYVSWMNADQFIGLSAILITCFLSGFAGVYFEKVLKQTPTSLGAGMNEGKPLALGRSWTVAHPCLQQMVSPHYHWSVWERNSQLAFYSIILSGLVGVWWMDYETLMTQGFWVGYNWVVWMVILNQAVGGVLVAMVVKYADNILKGFATSIAIIISSVVSIWLFEFMPSWTFIVGSLTVIYATVLYNDR